MKVDFEEPSEYSVLERPQSFNLGPELNKAIVHEIQGDVAAERRLKGPKNTPSGGINSRREMEPDDTRLIQSHDTDPSLNASQEKKYEERVEFSIDYDQPKAHPPSHN